MWAPQVSAECHHLPSFPAHPIRTSCRDLPSPTETPLPSLPFSFVPLSEQRTDAFSLPALVPPRQTFPGTTNHINNMINNRHSSHPWGGTITRTHIRTTSQWITAPHNTTTCPFSIPTAAAPPTTTSSYTDVLPMMQPLPGREGYPFLPPLSAVPSSPVFSASKMMPLPAAPASAVETFPFLARPAGAASAIDDPGHLPHPHRPHCGRVAVQEQQQPLPPLSQLHAGQVRRERDWENSSNNNATHNGLNEQRRKRRRICVITSTTDVRRSVVYSPVSPQTHSQAHHPHAHACATTTTTTTITTTSLALAVPPGMPVPLALLAAHHNSTRAQQRAHRAGGDHLERFPTMPRAGSHQLDPLGSMRRNLDTILSSVQQLTRAGMPLPPAFPFLHSMRNHREHHQDDDDEEEQSDDDGDDSDEYDSDEEDEYDSDDDEYDSDEDDEDEEDEEEEGEGLAAATLAQLDLPRFVYARGCDIPEPRCVICQEEYQDGDALLTLSCVHNFHAPCIEKWLACKAECPLCKERVVVAAAAAGGHSHH